MKRLLTRFLCYCTICMLMQSCLNTAPGFFVRMKEETNFIQTKDTLNPKYDSLAIIKPYVLVGEIKDYDLAHSIECDLLFNAPVTPNDYVVNEQKEKKLIDYCYYEYERFFKNKIPTYKITLSDTDEAVLHAAIYTLKAMFHREN